MRCGYNFDPVRHRAGYISYEQSQGTTAEDIVKLEKAYDTTLSKMQNGLRGADDYCTDDQTERIKKSLTKQLAGDYSAPGKRPPPPKNFWGASPPSDKLDRDKVLHPSSGRSG